MAMLQTYMKTKKSLLILFTFIAVAIVNTASAQAQHDSRKYRIAKIEVYPEYLDEYKGQCYDTSSMIS